jgi:hypothetical protein
MPTPDIIGQHIASQALHETDLPAEHLIPVNEIGHRFEDCE